MWNKWQMARMPVWRMTNGRTKLARSWSALLAPVFDVLASVICHFAMLLCAACHFAMCHVLMCHLPLCPFPFCHVALSPRHPSEDFERSPTAWR